MNNKNNLWAVLVDDPKMCEAVQRIAFSFGYQWNFMGDVRKQIRYLDAKVLYFNPDNKRISYDIHRRDVPILAYKVCTTMQDVMDCFANPPSRKNKSESFGGIEVFEDGTVVYGDKPCKVKVESDVFDKIVETRNKLMGKENATVLEVRFTYHSVAKTGGAERIRNVLVKSVDDTYLCGLDMDDNNVFKRFRKDQIGVHGITVIRFEIK